MQSYDIIIVGGGLVGAGLAVALRETPLRIALIDAKMPSNTDPRLFGLTASSIQFLKNIHVWERLEAHATPIHAVHVSNKGRFGAVRLNRQDVSLPSLGHVIPACAIETVLNDELSHLENITLYRPATLKTLSQSADRASLTLDINNQAICIEAPLVIGADGTESTVRTQAGITAEVTDYHQMAIVTRIRLQRSHQHVAHERFNQQGAIAMLPLADNECASIWTTTSEQAMQLMKASDEDYLQYLQTAFGYRLGKLCGMTKRFQFPLRMVQARENVAGGILLVGNAAHTLHPVAAQGFNLAIYEVAALSQEISRQITENQPLCAQVLAAIYKKTQSQQFMSIGISNRLVKLFSTKSVMMSCVLQMGMVGLDTMPSVKRNFIRRILGTANNPPDLLLANET